MPYFPPLALAIFATVLGCPENIQLSVVPEMRMAFFIISDREKREESREEKSGRKERGQTERFLPFFLSLRQRPSGQGKYQVEQTLGPDEQV